MSLVHLKNLILNLFSYVGFYSEVLLLKYGGSTINKFWYNFDKIPQKSMCVCVCVILRWCWVVLMVSVCAAAIVPHWGENCRSLFIPQDWLGPCSYLYINTYIYAYIWMIIIIIFWPSSCSFETSVQSWYCAKVQTPSFSLMENERRLRRNVLAVYTVYCMWEPLWEDSCLQKREIKVCRKTRKVLLERK